MSTEPPTPALTLDQEQWLADDVALRERARSIAAKLNLDEGDVYHFLKTCGAHPPSAFGEVWRMAEHDDDFLSAPERSVQRSAIECAA